MQIKKCCIGFILFFLIGCSHLKINKIKRCNGISYLTMVVVSNELDEINKNYGKAESEEILEVLNKGNFCIMDVNGNPHIFWYFHPKYKSYLWITYRGI